ncbi:mCG144565, partial [Mus musculus]
TKLRGEKGFWKSKVNEKSTLMGRDERWRSKDLGLLKVKWIFEC